MRQELPDAIHHFDSDATQVPPAVLLAVEDLAAMLRLSKRSVWRLRSAGILPRPLRLGGLVRWRKAEIDEWIASGCIPPPKTDQLRGGRRPLK